MVCTQLNAGLLGCQAEFPRQGLFFKAPSGKHSSGAETDKISLLFLTPVGSHEMNTQIIRASGIRALKDYLL